jgi:hypothetical protein
MAARAHVTFAQSQRALEETILNEAKPGEAIVARVEAGQIRRQLGFEAGDG